MQSALAAALPGDRILLAQDVLVTACMLPPVPAGLTFESAPGGPRRELFIADPGGTWGIQVGVTFRNLHIVCDDPGGLLFPQNNLDINAPGASVRFFDVDVTDRLAGIPDLPGSGGTRYLVNVTAGEVILKNTSMVATDGRTGFLGTLGVCDDEGAEGTDALIVDAQTLVLEDVLLRGGSAPVLCEGDPLGDGGAALRATTESTIMVRTALEDGNGGFTVVVPTPQVAATTPAGLSAFGTVSHISESEWTFGLPGSHPSVLDSRGFAVSLGEEAPLLGSGGEDSSAIVVENRITSNPDDAALGYALGLDVLPTPLASPFGDLFTNPFAFSTLAPGTSLSLPTSTMSSLMGRVLVFQSIQSSPLRFGNPTFIERHL